MTITIFGLLVLVVGSWLLLRGSMLDLLSFVMLMSLMNGSAAFVLTGLGGSTVPPAAASLPFLLLRCLLPDHARSPVLASALRANFLLIAFAIYGAISAYLLPRIFEGSISVTPLRPIPTDDPFVTFPLSFSSQNVTVSGYLLLTMAAGICAFMAATTPNAIKRLPRIAAIIAIVHAVLGFASVLVAGTPGAAFLEFFRNGFYAQLDQTVQGFVRMNGIFPEPSGFAAFGLIYFFFVTELWLLDVDARWTGSASLLLLAALVTSTSSTAYIGIAAYLVIVTLRTLATPGAIRAQKLIGPAIVIIVLILGAALTQLFQPGLIESIQRIADRILFDKQQSLSGMQRLMWAKQGLEAFWASGGLGIGMGSFRSSSLLTAILGSTGVIGITTFAAHLLKVLKPFRQSTYRPPHDARVRVGVAAAWTMVIMLIPASATAASPDPGLTWGLLGGLALALRSTPDMMTMASKQMT
jgi:hypothetical protein